MSELPHAFGAPRARGVIRQSAEDFFVFEELSFEPGDGGEHVWLFVRKRGWNTTDLALWLARAAKVPLRSVGYSGLKDRHAVTEQWFSIHLPGKSDPEWPLPMPDGIEILKHCRHTRKLNRGTHRANFFSLRIRALEDSESLPARLQQIAERGVPNYFGEQRFGRDKGNWQRGCAWLKGEGEAPRKAQLKSFWLSAVRSGLFNAVLAERVRRDCWDAPLVGDVCQPDGSRGLFNERDDVACAERIAAGDVHPTAPMPGVGGVAAQAESAALEQQVLASFQAELVGLCEQGVEAARRATRLPVRDLRWSFSDAELLLEFRLPTGSFATSVLAELVELKVPAPVSDDAATGEEG